MGNQCEGSTEQAASPAGASAFVIARNELPNISRCLRSLQCVCQVDDVIVLDSGSTDGTTTIIEEHGVERRAYNYQDHCTTYNEVTRSLAKSTYCIVLDADMTVDESLVSEALGLLSSGADVVRSPVDMTYAGKRLRYASLYPAKPWAFRSGEEYFRPDGHGEALCDGLVVEQTDQHLIHDDRKPYRAFLESQLRYARALRERAAAGGKCTTLDRLRLRLPVGVLLVPLASYFFKAGFLDGTAGLIYALDRLIAEAIIYRSALFERCANNSNWDAND